MASTMLFTLALTGASCLPLSAQEWPRFRGPAGQGHGTAELPLSFTENNVRWRVDVGGSGHSSPVLWGKRLFLTRVGEGEGEREVVCYDAASGVELWAVKCAFTPHKQHQLNSFASATPAVDELGVYLLWTSGPKLTAAAFDHEGEVLWQQVLGEFYGQHGSANSPILHGDLVIVANENEGDDCFLTALDRATGEPRWRLERQQSARWACYSPPLVYRTKSGDPLLLIASSAHGLTAVDPQSGKVKWEANPGFKNRFIAVPCLADDLVLVHTGSGNSGKECVVFELSDSGDEEPAVRYRPRRNLPYVPSAIAVNGRYFLFSDAGFASCIEATSGVELWRERTDSRFFSSPVSNGRAIYIADRDGRLHTFSTAKFEVLGTYDLGAPVCATPALALGRMFVRTADQLICLGPAKDD